MPALLLLLACIAPPESASISIPLTDDAVVTLASVQQGREILGRHDAYINATGGLERQIRLRSEQPVSVEAFVKHAQDQVIPWTNDQKKRLQAIVESLADKLDDLNLPLPEEVLLIQTTGDEESGAAYTRAHAIVLSRQRLSAGDAALQRLLAHELFHVLSRHDADLRKRLYAIIGFHPCNPVELPADLAASRISNPDAPTRDFYINIEHDDEEIAAVPVLFSDRDQFDPRRQRLFDYLQFRLLAVHRVGDSWQPLLRDEMPMLIDGRANKSYRQQIGDNTNYIIHPDEILADNFAHLVMRTKELKSPKIVEEMRKHLASGER